MASSVVTFIVGIICIVLGISNMRGNISSLHSYHRNRVKEEDVLPFGKLVGIGTIIIGVAVILMGIFTAISITLSNEIYTTIGTVVMFIGIAAGMGVAFYAMKKYNGGIM